MGPLQEARNLQLELDSLTTALPPMADSNEEERRPQIGSIESLEARP